MNYSTFEIEFFELATLLKQPLNADSIQSLKKTLLKLNNPTYYRKYTSSHPAAVYGYYQNKILNPILAAVSEMLIILKDNSEKTGELLQREYSWAFHRYPEYQQLEQRNA